MPEQAKYALYPRTAELSDGDDVLVLRHAGRLWHSGTGRAVLR